MPAEDGALGAPADPDDLGAGALPDGLAQQIIATAVLPYCVLDRAGTVRWASPSIHELLGHRPEELVGRSVLDLLEPADRERVVDALSRAEERTRAGAPGTWEGSSPTVALARADGTSVPCQLAVAMPHRTGYDGYIVQLQRVSGIHALHQAMRSMAAGDHLRVVLRHLIEMAEHDLPWIHLGVSWDWDGARFTRAEGGPARVDLTPDRIAGLPWERSDPTATTVTLDELAPDLQAVAVAAGVREVWLRPVELQSGGRALIAAWHLGRWLMTAFTAAALDRYADLVAMALRWDDDRQQLAWAATHDQLTGLRNQRSFVTDVARASSGPATVLYLDLDDFKPVNDEHGHGQGDQVLAEIAQRLRAIVRPDDVVARLGGDEFAVLCPEALDDGAVAALTTRLMQRIGEPFHLGGTTLQVGVSIGVATIDGAGDPDELIRRADQALRQAKADGKHRVARS